MKGIILAGGAGTRLYPLTLAVSKQLLPVYDMPMVYYPLTTLMLAGIREILLITTQTDAGSFSRLLGNGSQWGIRINYATQARPEGIPQAFLIAEDFIANDSVCLILGDNIFYGAHLVESLTEIVADQRPGATIFVYAVSDPERYGIVEFDAVGTIVSLEEKPKSPKSRFACTGIYFYDSGVVDIARGLKPSERGELEIMDVNRIYLAQGNLRANLLGRGTAWLDTGTFESLLDAGMFFAALERRQGLKVGCPEEVALRKGYIDAVAVRQIAEKLQNVRYGQYLRMIVEELFPS